LVSLLSKCLKFYTANIKDMVSHTVALNMSCPCTDMPFWWWFLVSETCSKNYIIDYIVAFWLNDILVSMFVATTVRPSSIGSRKEWFIWMNKIFLTVDRLITYCKKKYLFYTLVTVKHDCWMSSDRLQCSGRVKKNYTFLWSIHEH
jgi:hypothetical protein